MTARKHALPGMATRQHTAFGLPDHLLRFSFMHLQSNRKFGLSDVPDASTYFRQLLQRLQAMSTLRPAEFRTAKDKSLRAHRHDWEATTEPGGYVHLTADWRRLEAWQFQLSANKHGRVHGILVDEVFYIV